MPATLCLLIINNIKYEFRTIVRLIVELVIVVLVGFFVVFIPTRNAGFFDPTDLKNTHFTAAYSIDNLDALKESLKLKGEEMKFDVMLVPKARYSPVLMEKFPTDLGKLKNYDIKRVDREFDSRHHLAIISLDSYFPPYYHPTFSMEVSFRFPSIFRTIDDAEKNIDLWQSRCTGILRDKDIPNDILDQDLYLREGFLQLQHAVFITWYRYLPPYIIADYKEYKITVRFFRHIMHQEDCNAVGSSFVEFLYWFAFMLPFFNSVWKYAREWQLDAPAHHWIFGYNMKRYWFAHFIVSFVRLMIHCAVLTMIIMIPWTENKYSIIFKELDPLYMVLFLMLYITALILTAMVIALLMGNAKNAVLLAIAMWLSCYGIFSLVLEHWKGLQSVYVLMTFVLFFNTAFPYGMRYMQNIREAISLEEIWILMIVMIINIIVQCMLLEVMLYCKPGRYMDGKQISFCGLLKWYSKRLQAKKRMAAVMIRGKMPDKRNFENVQIGGEEYIRMKNICLNLNKSSRAKLINITMRVYKGEITVLVGPYGSGKTLLHNILCGWRKPEAGKLCLYKYYIDTDWETARHQIGVVTPENSLFDLLTCAETLKYFVSIKQLAHAKSTKNEVNKWLEILKPEIDADQFVCKMTFEQKRLICLCCAMCCDTKIILLDEPVAHMRTKEQRFFFSIMQKEKANRAIFMTTYSINDAEIVADRIAILMDGLLMAYGTIFFLKTTVGIVCDLIIIKDITTPIEPITKIIARYFPYITPDNAIGNQITYKIPTAKRTICQRMLLQLEKESKHLGIQDIRLLSSELSEIYESLDRKKNSQVISDITKLLKVTYETRCDRSKQQFSAMLYKKMLHQVPNIIPFLVIVGSVIVIHTIDKLAFALPLPELPSLIEDGFTLGLNRKGTRRWFIPGLSKCKFIAVTASTSSELPSIEALSRLFEESFLYCGRSTFEDYIRNSTTLANKLGAIEVDEATKSAVVWINQHIFHSAPIILNLLHNYILELNFGKRRNVFMKMRSNPLPIPFFIKIKLIDELLTHLRLPLAVGIIIPITISTFIFQLVQERSHNLLVLQVLAGLHMYIYWVVNFIWDFFTYFAFICIYMLVLSMSVLNSCTFYVRVAILMLMSIYGVAALLMTYFISMFFSKSIIRGFLVCVIIQLLTGICAYVFYWDIIDRNELFFYIASVSPTFSLLDGISNLYAGTKESEYCEQKCEYMHYCSEANMCTILPECCYNTYFRYDNKGILFSITYMSISAVIFAFLIIFVQLRRTKRRRRIPAKVKKMKSACHPYDDINVVKMKMQIAEADRRQHLDARFVVDQLENFVPRRGRKLNTVSFVVNKHECLGIFGTRKCGKSHLARQLVGIDDCVFGEIYVVGMEMRNELYDINKITGYCPQVYGYANPYRIRELMHILCMIRGVPTVLIPNIISKIALSLDIKRIFNRKIGTLNMDQRRKVNIAVAFIAYNKVVVFDEPTRGLSPHTRREVWNVLRYARYCGKTLIFTTSDIDECGMLADQTVVFEDGEMLAVGSLYNMRNQYTIGFYLEVKISRDGGSNEEIAANLEGDLHNLKRFVLFLHERSVLIGQIDTIYKFYVPVDKVIYSYLYGALEKNRRRLNIIEYTVSMGNMGEILHNITARRTHKKKFPKY